MNVLAPLYLAGLAAVSLPLLFHLIRRTPRGQTVFSSLMFLKPSPPRLTRRSRLDQLLLLLLRALILTLLAVAFARPFFRDASQFDLSGTQARKIAILLDRSASMRRGTAWQDAGKIVQDVLKDLGPNDAVGLYAFDNQVETLIGVADSQQLEAPERPVVVREALAKLAPTWSATDVGSALIRVADSLDEMRDGKDAEIDARLQIIMVTDMQSGSQLEALQSYEWPKDVRLEVRSVEPAADNRSGAGATNAGLHLMYDLDSPDALPHQQRVRVSNSAHSSNERFRVGWKGENSVEVYVPPGKSQVVRIPRRQQTDNTELSLEGDDFAFDNTLHFAPSLPQKLQVLIIGDDDPDSSKDHVYYLKKIFIPTARRSIELRAEPELPTEPLVPAITPLVIVTHLKNEQPIGRLRQYAEQGGRILAVVNDAADAERIGQLVAQENWAATNIDHAQSRYSLLGEIAFSHPLFNVFASPQFSDFTKIHFWRYRKLEQSLLSEEVKAIARFDNEDPAVLQTTLGTGSITVFTSSWRPEDSELALSSKFPPILMRLLLGDDRGDTLPSYRIDQTLQLPAELPETPIMFRPDDQREALPRDSRQYDKTDLPGIYQILGGGGKSQYYSVNLAPEESKTDPLDTAALEQRGVQMGRQPTREQELERRRQMRDIELEKRQKIWRYLIAAALAVMIAETWLAGRNTVSAPTPVAEPA